MLKSSGTTGKYFLNLTVFASLLVIPLILFLTSLDTINSRDKTWYGGGYDPEYAYLFNALNVVEFRQIGHIDHPGTTMQITGGIVLKVAWMFDPRGENLTNAVMAEPEHYLRILNVATSVIGSFALFLLAFFLYRRTKNIGFAFILQLTPFISGFVLFNGFTRVTQEVMQMIAAFALASVSLIWYFQQGEKHPKKFIILFGVISGFGMASKILFAPLLIIPFVLLNTLKGKLWYILVSCIAFVVFTLPIVRLYPNMLYWIYKLFIHTGQYGAGSTGVIDWSRYPDALFNLFKVSPVLAAIFGVSILVLLTFPVIRLVKKSCPDARAARLLAAVIIAQAIGYLLVAKQPKESYLLPYESIVAVNVVIILYLIMSFLHQKTFKFLATGFVTLVLVVAVIPYGIARKKAIYTTQRNQLWENAYQMAVGSADSTAVIFANPGASPIVGLYFGNAYSIRRYVTDLQRLYPDCYVVSSFEGGISHWGNGPVMIDSLFMKYQGKIIYSGMAGSAVFNKEFLKLTIPGWEFRPFFSDGYNELWAPVEINANGEAGRYKLLFCNAEDVPESLLKSNPCQEMAVIGEKTSEKAFSGKWSIKTDETNPYAFAVKPSVFHVGDKIDISVKVSGNSDIARIIASGQSSAQFYETSGKPVKSLADGWSLLRLNFEVPLEMDGKEIKVYSYNNGHETAYFDDFRMAVYCGPLTLN
ncbi:MAG: hypothetical protein H6542_03560 [Lentimicrobiaceae bacterium]|nr:hypothetical protein [Lentimicrobiaceae bacterium]